MFRDLATIQAYVTLVKDIVTTLAAVGAAFIAFKGLQAWRQQLTGGTEYQLAQRLLRATYKAREAFKVVRSPYQSGAEIAQAMKDANIEGSILDPAVRAQSTAAVYQKRWQRVQDAFADLEAVALEAEAVWGRPARERFLALQACANTLIIHLQMYIQSLDTSTKRYTPNDEQMKRIEEVIYGSGTDDEKNQFSDEIGLAITAAEDFLRPYLKLKGG